jgi:hypothetical protein
MIDKCIQKDFTRAKDIGDYFSNLNFKEGKWFIQIYHTDNSNVLICEYYSLTKIPNKYFRNPDTNSVRYINNRAVARLSVIEKIMMQENIKMITIKLCPISKVK